MVTFFPIEFFTDGGTFVRNVAKLFERKGEDLKSNILFTFKGPSSNLWATETK